MIVANKLLQSSVVCDAGDREHSFDFEVIVCCFNTDSGI